MIIDSPHYNIVGTLQLCVCVGGGGVSVGGPHFVMYKMKSIILTHLNSSVILLLVGIVKFSFDILSTVLAYYPSIEMLNSTSLL